MAMPYLKIHPADYLNDYAINNLSCEEFGVLIRLFLLMWQSNLQLHNDDVYISRQLNIDSDIYATIKAKLIKYLIIIQDDNGTLINSGIKTKFLAALAYSKQQAEKKQGRKRKPATI